MNDSKDNLYGNAKLPKNEEEDKSNIDNKEIIQKLSNESDVSENDIHKHMDEIENKIIEEEKKEDKTENVFSIFENKNNKNNEEEKNNEEKNKEQKNNFQSQYLSTKQKLILEEEAHRKELLKKLQKYYEDLFNDIVYNWKSNQENFENYILNINPNIKSILDVSCIVSNQDNVVLIFKFLCKYFNFFKDKLKIVPIEVVSILYKLNECEIFSKNPKNINTSNILNSNNDLIEDKIFYQIFKEFFYLTLKLKIHNFL